METDVNYPLLVKIQSVNIQSLDFKTTGSQKNRNVTCIEASNLFVFVGCTSGTVFVFSRETLTFRFVIPFKGGKVCSISCADNERDVAVGSIRGKVSLYQLLAPTTKSAQGAFFKHSHTVTNHTENEITELHWSPKGRYLFIGDSQGLVSQVDVGGYEEFPRPVSPSQVILKLKSRIIQLDFVFPYLAACTVSSVYLCDVEDEDFVRVQVSRKQDIRASGIALSLTIKPEPVSQTNVGSLLLFVSDMGSGLVHSFDMQGLLIESKKVGTDSVLARDAVSVFDPVRPETESLEGLTRARDPVTVSLGKLYLTDDNFLVSASHDHFYMIEPKGMSLVLWTEDFHRIHSLKLMSNYVFIWNGGRLDVVSLTQFRQYGEQLFKAEITPVLQRWTTHALHSVGWRTCPELGLRRKEEEEAEAYFRTLLGTQITDEDEFCVFISKEIPFRIVEPRPITPPPPVNPLLEPLTALLNAITEECESGSQSHNASSPAAEEPKPLKPQCSKVSLLWDASRTFFLKLKLVPCPPVQKRGLVTLSKFMLSLQTFFQKEELVNLYKDISSTLSAKKLSTLEGKLPTVMKTICTEVRASPATLELLSQPLETEDGSWVGFISFSKYRYVAEWFGELGISRKELGEDAMLADLLVTFSPLFPPRERSALINEFLGWSGCERGFFTWLVCSTVCNPQPNHPYESQLRALFSKDSRKFSVVKELFGSVYRDIVDPDIRTLSASLHHFISAMFLVLDGKRLEKSLRTPNTFLYTLLISAFPIGHWPKEDVEKKVISLCRSQPVILRMFQAACLANRGSVLSCRCGIPLQATIQTFDLRDYEPTPQRIAQEAILELLIQRHLTLSDEDTGLKESGVFQFAMKTGLWKQVLQDLAHEVDDETVTELILRTSSCPLLENLRLSRTRVNLLLEKLEHLRANPSCRACGDPLALPQTFRFLSYDCIGIWILKGAGTLEGFANYLKMTPGLNSPGRFSLQFFQLIQKWNDEGDGNPGSSDRNRSTNSGGLSCSPLHS